MGIFDALSTAVTGLQAQAYAIQNISGNIANSQTTAFKRVDTSFEDMIPDEPLNQQTSGSVASMSVSTNTVQGGITSASVGTFMAVNGSGFFVVSKPDSFTNGVPVFSGAQEYTRRGDFQPDSNGYLVNGAGYYLMGIPLDPTTGLETGSTPQILQFQNSTLPAQATSEIDYEANLPSGATALNPAMFSANPINGAPTTPEIIGSGATLKPDAPATVTGTANLGSLSATAGTLVINGTNVTINAGDNLAAVEADINGAGTGATASDDGAGHLVLTGPDDVTPMVIGASTPSTLLSSLGLASATIQPTNLITQGAAANGETLTVTIGANATQTITFGTGNVVTMTDLTNALATITNGTATLNATNGDISITSGLPTDDIVIGGTAKASNFGINVSTALPATGNVIASDNTAFLANSLDGGTITGHDQAGSPVSVAFRWAKVGANTWNLYYQSNTTATGQNTEWTNVGTNYTFAANGQMSPALTSSTLTGLTVNGDDLGNVSLKFGSSGLTQFADTNEVVKVNLLQENSVASGTLQQVSVNDKGQIVGTYSNGRTLGLADVPLATFNGANMLKGLDGGAYAATQQSGSPMFGNAGSIVGSSLEGSNTDIADEFTKLIVTQQAYSANTKVITTSNQMVQTLMDMLR
ncbi:MAG TPA: flagellar hook-basal body complex protein [Pseudolabrys sp.]|nr:flagellar hook-basal body complex protein [Pseudolabrys sp.]